MEEKELVEEFKKVKEELSEIKSILKELIFIAAVDATETMQVTENTSRMLRGEVPEGCQVSHFRLRENIIESVLKWNGEKVKDLKKHLFGHF